MCDTDEENNNPWMEDPFPPSNILSRLSDQKIKLPLSRRWFRSKQVSIAAILSEDCRTALLATKSQVQLYQLKPPEPEIGQQYWSQELIIQKKFEDFVDVAMAVDIVAVLCDGNIKLFEISHNPDALTQIGERHFRKDEVWDPLCVAVYGTRNFFRVAVGGSVRK